MYSLEITLEMKDSMFFYEAKWGREKVRGIVVCSTTDMGRLVAKYGYSYRYITR